MALYLKMLWYNVCLLIGNTIMYILWNYGYRNVNLKEIATIMCKFYDTSYCKVYHMKPATIMYI